MKKVRLLFLLLISMFIFLETGLNLVLGFDFFINNSDPVIETFDNISFIIQINIENNEKLPIDYIRFELTGQKLYYCKFLPDSKILSGCRNILVELLNYTNPSFGELKGNYNNIFYNWKDGFGFGEVNNTIILKYKITLINNDSVFGNYQSLLKTAIDNNIFLARGNNFIISEPINITNIPIINNCIFENSSFDVEAKIAGDLKNAFVEVNSSGMITEFNASRFLDKYKATIFNISGEIITYRFIATNLFNNKIYGENVFITLEKNTIININPKNPDGLNNWYIAEPKFSFFNPSATNIYYKWDNYDFLNYSQEFGFEDSLNFINNSGGIFRLYYYSKTNLCDENLKFSLINLDLSNPKISIIYPENETIIYDDYTPEIYVTFNEIYFKNSGINSDSVILKLDNEILNTTIIKGKNNDYYLKYRPDNNLAIGTHTIEAYVEDNSRRNSTLYSSFEIRNSLPSDIIILNPINNSIHNTNRIDINISSSDVLLYIDYINLNEKNPKWKKLCTNCNNYGFKTIKKIKLVNYDNNIIIRTKDKFSNIKEFFIKIYADPFSPKIVSTYPVKNTLSSFESFFVSYSEKDLKEVSLNIYSSDNEIILSQIKNDCESGETKICSFENITLEDYYSKELYYNFELKDAINNVSSEKIKFVIDNIKPVIIINNPLNNLNYTKKIPINLTINKDVMLEIKDLTLDLKSKKLCSDCNSYGEKKEKFIALSKGRHELLIKAVDKAGNSDERIISLFVE
jgi:hypothetical protein